MRIDGEDYRHRGLPEAPAARTSNRDARGRRDDGASLDHFVDLCRHLARGAPQSKYGALLDGVRVVCLEDVRTVDDQAVALRLVVLADRMYDRDLPVVASGVQPSTSCSRRRCSRAATARSTSGPSAASWRWRGTAQRR